MVNIVKLGSYKHIKTSQGDFIGCIVEESSIYDNGTYTCANGWTSNFQPRNTFKHPVPNALLREQYTQRLQSETGLSLNRVLRKIHKQGTGFLSDVKTTILSLKVREFLNDDEVEAVAAYIYDRSINAYKHYRTDEDSICAFTIRIKPDTINRWIKAINIVTE